MPVVVPSAPDVQETTRMLEDSESVGTLTLPAAFFGSAYQTVVNLSLYDTCRL